MKVGIYKAWVYKSISVIKLAKFREVHGGNPNDTRLGGQNLAKFRRALFVVGLLIRYFDFSKEELYQGLKVRLYFSEFQCNITKMESFF